MVLAGILIFFAQATSFIDTSDADLVRAVPELAQVQFAHTPDFPGDLSAAFGGFADVSASEEVHIMQLDPRAMIWNSRVQKVHSASLPPIQPPSRFRYLGTTRLGGRDALVGAFAGAEEGIVWIDSAAKQVVRVLIVRSGYRSDVRLAAVRFRSGGGTLWLPSRMTVDEGDRHTVHRYSDYRLNNSEGVSASPESRAEDTVERLVRGAEVTKTNPAEAVRVLQEAVRLDADKPESRYQLGLAFHAIGDLADAEAELREAVSRIPDCAPCHNYLGIVLFQLGNKKAAAEEFKAAARLAPQDPNAALNLGEALTAAGSTISVDVRQVLVPVVVTDKQGHHVTGLTQADFKIFEDGVEQKIAAFSVEHSGLSQMETSATTTAPASRPLSSPARQTPARRTYVICIDTLHGIFTNFVAAREALVKLFQHERSEDSQYVLIALGTTAQMVVNVTPDPNAILTALQQRNFQKFFLDGQLGGVKQEMVRYRRDLTEVRQSCDMFARTGEMAFQIKCDAGKTRVALTAQSIAELDRTVTISFLRQFRFLVAQLARARDRRTMVLLSDGFLVVPGREAWDLLNAFFPDLRGNTLRGIERLQDEFEPILQLAAKSNVTIDTIDLRGLYGSSVFDVTNEGATVNTTAAVDRVDRGIETSNGGTLNEIAAATGGTAFRDSNDLLSGLERAFADGRDYYTIAYVSGNANLDGKFRAISVRVRDRNLVVNAKRGYWSERVAQ